MPLINESYFVGQLNIPDTDQAATLERLNWFIERYEREFLVDVMGYRLYKAFVTGITQANVDTRWKNLLKGCEFTNRRSLPDFWIGIVPEVDNLLTLKDSDSINAVVGNSGGNVLAAGSRNNTNNTRVSMIAHWVYINWMLDRYSQTTPIGESVPSTINGDVTTPRLKIVEISNQLAEFVCQFNEFLFMNQSVYPEWDTAQYSMSLSRYRKTNSFGI